MTESTIRTFAIVVENDVIAAIHVPPTSSNADMLIAGFSSSPTIVEATGSGNVGFGWTYENGIFTSPQGS